MLLVAALQALAPGPVSAQRASAPVRASMVLAAAPDPRPARTVTLVVEGATLAEALDEVGRQAELRVMYGEEVIESERRISLRLRAVPVSTAFRAVLAGTGLAARISTGGAAVVIRGDREGEAEAAPSVSLAGRVLDASTGQPLVGARILVEGSDAGTVSGPGGHFDVADLPRGTHRVRASMPGYAPEELEVRMVSSGARVRFALSAETIAMEELVVMGYGEKRRSMLTESVGVVSGVGLPATPIASPELAMQGRAAGVQIIPESGTPGAPVAVRIRGVGTVGNTQPLFVVDGMPVGKGENAVTSPLSSLNPADIESLTVLKDASAAAVYGVQAANGVVLIQTKRGRYGKPMVRYDAYAGVQNFPRRLAMSDTRQWLELTQEAYDNYNAQFGYTPSDPGFRELHPQLRGDSPLFERNTDWFSVVNRSNAPIRSQNLSVSGATDDVRYYVSAGSYRQAAIIDNWDLRRLSFRANTDFAINGRMRVGESFSVSNETVNRGENALGNGMLLRNALRLPPFFRYRDSDGSVPENRYGFDGNFNVAGITMANEPAINQLLEYTDRNARILGAVYAELDPLPGVTLRSQAGLDLSATRNTSWNPGFTMDEVGLARPDQASDQRGDRYGLVWTNTLAFARSFGNHDLSLLAGVETQQFHGASELVEGSGFLVPDPTYRAVPENGAIVGLPSGWAGESAYLGYIGRVSYNYADRYLLTGSVRRDGASAFAPSNRWGTFPSVSAGWRVSREPWFHVPWVSELKLRGSWGQLGNSSIEGSAYPYLLQISTTPDYAFGNTPVKVPVPAGFVNSEVTWERNQTVDLGFEASLLDSRLALSATYYRRNTHNFLVNVPLPLSSGFQDTRTGQGGAPFNTGLVRNSGFELEGGYHTRMLGAVSLDVSGNLTTVRNRLMSLAEGIDEYSQQGVYRTSVGYPIGYFYGYQTCGIYQTAAAAAAAPQDKTIGNNKPQAGDVCFQDVRGPYEIDPETGRKIETPPDGIIDANDRSYLGKTIPDLYYGINLNSTYRQFDLGLLFTGVGGVHRYSAMRRDLEALSGGAGNLLASTRRRWTGEGTSKTMPRAVLGDPNQNDRFSDRWVENGSYFRLKTVQLGYRLPDHLLGVGLGGTRLYVSATNLFVLTPYEGFDPEFTTSIDIWRSRNDNQLAAGTDTGNLPQPRTIQIGVSTAF